MRYTSGVDPGRLVHRGHSDSIARRGALAAGDRPVEDHTPDERAANRDGPAYIRQWALIRSLPFQAGVLSFPAVAQSGKYAPNQEWQS